MSFVGGKLKLKGVVDKVSKKKKKSNKEKKEKAAQGTTDAGAEGDDVKLAIQGYQVEEKEGQDTRTDAERRYDEYMREREKKLLLKQALKSSKERVHEFNEKLSNLSEHHDIPKVDGSW